ncbi:MAG: glycosyltransferase, partial [Candidatus Hodarchaeota archaeon]
MHYITTKPGIISRSKEKDGFFIEYHRLMRNPLLSIMKVQNVDTFIIPCLRSILKNDFDIVQTTFPMDAFAASIAKTMRGISFVHYMIDSFQPYYYITKYGKFMLKKSVNSAARVTAPSHFIIDDIKKNFGLDALLTPPAVDTDQFRLCGNKDLENPRILYTSSLHDPRKGFIILVRAFERLLDYIPGARLQLSGHVHPKAIEIMYESVGLKARRAIDILGVGRREDLPGLYRNAAVTVLPSLNESFGMVLLESLASGTPIVGSRSGGIPDIFINSNAEIGILFEPKEGSEGLCEAIMRGLELAKDPGVWKKCRSHAESFSWDKIGPRFERIYGEIVDGKEAKKVSVHAKKGEVSKKATGEFKIQTGRSKFTLNRVFDDALDELEIDYDTYHKVDLFKPLSTYILSRLLKKGVRRGRVLVIGPFPLPLTLLFEKLGFDVEGVGIVQRHEPWKDIQNPMRISDMGNLKDLTGRYDVIVFDGILKHLQDPGRILRILSDKLITEGTLILITRNKANAQIRCRISRGNDNDRDVGLLDDLANTGSHNKVVMHRIYTLREIEKLVTNAGFKNESNYMIKEKALEGSLFPIPIGSYFLKNFYYFVQ